jgi:hypothetical protein
MKTRRTTFNAALSTAAAAAVCAALAGCSTNADANPAPSTTSTGTATTGGTSTTPSRTTSTTLDAAAQEKKDRQDAELVWRKLEGLAIEMTSLTPDQAEQAFQQVAVDPQLTRLRGAYQTLTSKGEAGYGQPIIAVAWREPINGANTATLYDCQDGSQAGYLDKKTGNKLTVGTPDTPMTVSLQRTAQGWRVSSFTIDQVNKCTPGV